MIFSKFERMVSFRYLRSKRRESVISAISTLSLLGIAIGVAALIIVMAVMNGFRHDLLSRILGLNGHMGVYPLRGAILSDYEGMEKSLREIPQIKMVFPLIEGQVMVSSPSRSQGAIVRGIRPEDLRFRDIMVDNMKGGNYDVLDEEDTIIVGYRLLNKMGLNIGDTLTLISPRGNVTAFGTMPRMKSYTVGATFNVGMSEYDSNFIFMNIDEAQVYFDMEDYITNLEIFLHNLDDIPTVMEIAQPIVKGRGRLFDWQKSNQAFFNAVKVERNVMFIILTLIIIVAALNIISGMIMLVKDKGRDIAILRTMGATKGMILRVFFITGASIGVVGTFVGLILGLLFCSNIENIRRFLERFTDVDLFNAEIYFLSTLPARVETEEVVMVCAMSLLLSFVATLYPAYRASKLEVVEALRYE